jgi:hypothetical protein
MVDLARALDPGLVQLRVAFAVALACGHDTQLV